MRNKDKRTIALSMIIGDGNLHIDKKGYARLSIDHGVQQKDYQEWKANLLSYALDRAVKTRSGHKGNSIQIQTTYNTFKAWYKFCYINNKKSIPKILRWIDNPYFALAIWLMDDGYVEANGKSKYKDKVYDKVTSARLRIFTCDQNENEQLEIINWFKLHIGIEPKIAYQHNKKRNIKYPYLKIKQEDSLKIWDNIRDKVLSIPSMQYKFRHLEHVYQFKSLQYQMRS